MRARFQHKIQLCFIYTLHKGSSKSSCEMYIMRYHAGISNTVCTNVNMSPFHLPSPCGVHCSGLLGVTPLLCSSPVHPHCDRHLSRDTRCGVTLVVLCRWSQNLWSWASGLGTLCLCNLGQSWHPGRVSRWPACPLCGVQRARRDLCFWRSATCRTKGSEKGRILSGSGFGGLWSLLCLYTAWESYTPFTKTGHGWGLHGPWEEQVPPW